MRKIDKVIIFDSCGLAKVMFDFNENQLILDEVLLSGFLSAIDGISQSIFQGNSSYFVINNGDTFLVLHGIAGFITQLNPPFPIFLPPYCVFFVLFI